MAQLICVLSLFLVAAVLVGYSIYVVATLWKVNAVEGDAAMDPTNRPKVTPYLQAFGAGLVFMIFALWSLDLSGTTAMSSLLCAISLLVGATFLMTVAIYVVATLRKGTAVEDGAAMPRGKRRIVLLYLLIVGSCLIVVLVSLLSLDFPETPVIPLPSEVSSPSQTSASSPASGTSTAAIAPAAATTPAAATKTTTDRKATPALGPVVPVLLRVFPQVKGEATTTPKLAAYGRNFSKDAKVRFNLQRVPTEYVTDHLLTASMENQYIAGRGSITVDVVDGSAVSNAVPVAIEKPQAPLNVFFICHPWVTREVQLLLLAIFAGALGSYLHALMSITEFIAGRKAIASWFWWYITRPFLGMAMGLVFYAVVRGGFLAGTPSDAKVVAPFGVLAIGALVGMFSDKAARKLGEIFDVVFRSAAARPDALAGDLLQITKLAPLSVIAGAAQPITVKITGKSLGKVSAVRVNNDSRTPDAVSETEITFQLKPADLAQAGQLQISVAKPDGVVSNTETITVSTATDANAVSPAIGPS